ncbi:peptidylprolyl isomerase [Puniceicoccales bacterium CK1056]|uniref:Peptidylprolyl isomerase n=1 Tax=Oceanipulchritudo coccoides TaxID=2706888 RepID=A0A6B2M5S1_9BACT|nr:peptidylprolyl isomerase [Oceanipulchritudo coccoides]NDV63487.1 peptidylprolyl isomerase [Oceanipulchritudo coccoides]
MRSTLLTRLSLFCLALIPVGSLISQTAHNVWDPPFKQGIAAEVENTIITFEELRREMAPLIPRIRESSRSRAEFTTRMEELYFEVLQNLIDRVLIVEEFKDKEFNIPQTYVENEYDRILIEDFENDRSRFLEYLQSQGKNVREFRNDLRERIVVSIMRAEKRKSQSQISPERIEQFYNENKINFYEEEAVKLRIIMLRPLADENPDQMRQTIENIYAELNDGADFSEVAQKYSQDSRRERGGDWGWIQRPDLKDELSAVAFQLDKNAYSNPVKLGDQTFILFAEDKRDEGIQPINEVRDRIEEILASQLARQAQEQWLERLRREAYIRYY